MEIIDKKPIPLYEVTCWECESIIRYRASEVIWCHITCPVCGVSIWANTIQPIMPKPPKEEKHG